MHPSPRGSPKYATALPRNTKQKQIQTSLSVFKNCCPSLSHPRMPPLNIEELRKLWKAGPDWLSESRFNRLKELEGKNGIGPQNVTGPHSTIETYHDDWSAYWRNYSGNESAAYYASLFIKQSIFNELNRSLRKGDMTQHDLEMYRRLGGRGLQGQKKGQNEVPTWEEYQNFATIVPYQKEVGTPSFTKEKFDKLLDIEKHRVGKSHTKDKLFRHYSDWADYCSYWGITASTVLEKKEKLKAAGARARALFSSREPVSNAAAPGWDDWDSRELDGEMAWEKEDDGGGLPPAGGEPVYDDDAGMLYSPEDGPASGMPSHWDDDGEGGLGIPARLADMMSMLHVRLLSLEAGVNNGAVMDY